MANENKKNTFEKVITIESDQFIQVFTKKGKSVIITAEDFINQLGLTSGGLESVVAGTNITIDDTDPANPIINGSGGGSAEAPLTLTGSADESQLIVLANATQSMSNPIFVIRDSSNAELMGFRTDNLVNTFVGYRAGLVNNYAGGAIDNTGFGSNCLVANTTGNTNTAFGKRCMVTNTIGNQNSAFGAGALLQNVSGSGSTAFGWHALSAATAGNNSAFGTNALLQNIGGTANAAFGNTALQMNVTGNFNTACGNDAFFACLGSSNTGVGYQAGYFTTAGSNTVVGYSALYNNVTGSTNTVLGALAAYSGGNATSGNVLLGYSAGYYETGSNRLFIDNQARTDEADARTKALITGVFAAAVANQRLTFNARVGIGGAATSTSYLNITGLPTSSAGLATGDVWSNSGVLTIV